MISCRTILSSVFAACLALSLVACASQPTPAPATDSAGEMASDSEVPSSDGEGSTPPAAASTEDSETEDSETEVTEAPPAKRPIEAPLGDCAGGVVLDDGSVETGYGFVPQATAGVYVQQFQRDAFDGAELGSVCVCFLKTKHSRDIEFDVVFYADAGGQPVAEPYASIPAIARDLPDSVASAGAFYEVDAAGVSLPDGPSFIGVRWNPNAAKFLFICTDTSEPTEATPVFFHDDLSPQWQSVFTSRDPIFKPHRSILIRANGQGTSAGDDASMTP